MSKPEEKEKELKEWLEQNGYDADSLEILLPFMRQDAGRFVQSGIELKLTEKDVDAIETIALQNDFDEFQTALLYKEYFEDKYKISTEDLMADYYDVFLNALKNQSRIFTDLLKKISSLSPAEVENEFKEYLEKIDQMNIKKLQNI